MTKSVVFTHLCTGWYESIFSVSLNDVFHGKRIFTPTLGWSSYCYGFLECDEVVEYVGTDVIPSVCKKPNYLPINTPEKQHILCQPSEPYLIQL